jgi:PAS domain S-box-containing protein
VEARPEHSGPEIKRLQHCMNDLLSVLALPAVWSGGQPSRIVPTLLDALLPMLELDLVYARLKDPLGDAPIEMARIAPSQRAMPRPEEIGGVLNHWFGDGPQKWPSQARKPFGDDDISIVSTHLGLGGEIGVIVAGSRRPDFPAQTERLVLSVAANQASIGLQEARLLSQQKRLASELDERVAERTAELAKANDELRNEIVERQKIDGQLPESEAAVQKAFDELKRSEGKFRQVFDAIPALAWCNFADGPNEFLNKRWHDYTGLSPEESHGWGWQAAFHPEDLPALLKRWGELLISGEPGEIEARLRRFDGVYRWFLISAEPLRDEAGRIVRWYGTSCDIEDRKRAEEALKASEAQLRLTVDTIPGLVCTMSPAGEIMTLNKKLLEYFGKTPEELKNWQMTDAVHPDDLPGVVAAFELSMRSGAPYEVEHRCRRADGIYRWFQVRALAMQDPDGQRAGWYVLLTDIEDRKRAEEELRRSEAFLAEAQRITLTGSFSWRLDTDEITFSEQLYRIFELDLDSPVTFAQIGSRVHPQDVPLLTEKIDLARGGVANHEYEIRLRMPDGKIKYLHTSGYGVRDRHGRPEYIGAIQDVTQRRSSDEELSKARSELARVSRISSLGVMTASIAHEINQPLSGIITNAGTCLRMLAADPPNVEGARETAKRTIRDGHRVSDVVTRLRSLFSKKGGTMEVVDLNEAAREVIAISLSGLQRNRVTVQQELADDLPTVMGDRIQLQQVILNLVRNASDAMSTVEDRGRQLLIRTGLDEAGHVRLAVRDVGIGFDPDAAERLFQAFYTTKSDGMGVGLSVSSSIIESHHGRLWATLNDGPGATFSFSVPCGPDSAARRQSSRERTSSTTDLERA